MHHLHFGIGAILVIAFVVAFLVAVVGGSKS